MAVRRIPKSVRDAIRRDYAAGITNGQELARRHNVSASGARNIALRVDVDDRWPVAVREQVRARYAAGEVIAQIAVACRMSEATVYRVLKKDGNVVRTVSQTKRMRSPLREDAFAAAEHDPEAAYWVGFIMADGCLCRGQLTLALAAKDGEHLHKLRSFLGADGCSVRRSVNESFSKSHDQVRFSVRSALLLANLRRYGVSERKSFAARVSLLERNVHFWRGVVDGDGGLWWGRAKPGWRPTANLALVGSRAMLQQYSDFVAMALSGHAVSVRPCHSIWQARVVGSRAAQLAAVLYENAPVSLDRKQALANEIMGWRRVLPDRSDLTLDRIIDLKKGFATWTETAAHLGMSLGALCALKRARRRKADKASG